MIGFGARRAVTPRLKVVTPRDGFATREAAAAVVAVLLALATGAMLVASPLLTFAAVVAAVTLLLLTLLGRRSAQLFVIVLGGLLILYAGMGRGVAYVGTGSLYIGEAVLFLGMVTFALNIDRARFGLTHWLIVAFMILGLARTIPYIGQYGETALRDGVVWGYAAFALAVSTTMDFAWADRLARGYRLFAMGFLVWVPIAMVLTLGFADRLPRWPGAPVPLVVVKQGDIAVQLAGIAAFVLVGLYARYRGGFPSSMMWALLFADLAIVAAVSRGGLLAAVLGAGSALLFVRSGQRLATAAAIALAGFVLLYAINPSLDVGSNAGRKLSFSQLVENAASVLTSTNAGNLQGTKEWRLAWWDTIVNYTINGPYFWTGKGFGINLADADGFQVLADHSLREPHNGHLALLARGGVPLLSLWILLQATFGLSLIRAAMRARAAGNLFLVQTAGVVFAIWLAALINMSFDVYLEGPQGGIWFWSVVGFGLVIMRAAQEQRDPGDARRAVDAPRPWPGAATGAAAGSPSAMLPSAAIGRAGVGQSLTAGADAPEAARSGSAILRGGRRTMATANLGLLDR